MDATLKTTLISAGVASVFSLLSIFINSYLTAKRERQQPIWKIELDRIIDVEERAGLLIEIVCSHLEAVDIHSKVGENLERLKNDAGRFRRYSGIMQAIRDLHHELSWIVSQKLKYEDPDEAVAKANKLYKIFLEEIDKVFGKRTL